MANKKRKKAKRQQNKRKYPTSLHQTYLGKFTRGSNLMMVLMVIMGLTGLGLGITLLIIGIRSFGG